MGSETSRRKARELISSLCGSAVNCENCIDRVATTLSAQEEQIDRLHRCIDMAMGCLDPLSQNADEKLAWYRLLDAQSGKEPRAALEGSKR